MWPLLQIVVRELPYRIESLDDLVLIRVFVDPANLAELSNGGACYHEPEGRPGWELRASASDATLHPCAEPIHGSTIRSTPVKWELLEQDYPTHDDLPIDMPNDLSEAYYDLEFANKYGTKVGGWPSNVQSEIYWAPHKAHPHDPRYVFQIDSDFDRGWTWGDNGVGYFGRGSGLHRDNWAMEWQCY